MYINSIYVFIRTVLLVQEMILAESQVINCNKLMRTEKRITIDLSIWFPANGFISIYLSRIFNALCAVNALFENIGCPCSSGMEIQP